MRTVSLILPVRDASTVTTEWVGRCRRGLEERGFTVDVVAVVDEPTGPRRHDVAGVDHWIESAGAGLTEDVLSGIGKTLGDVVVLLDPTRGYVVEDLPSLVEPVADGGFDLIVARGEEVGRPRIGDGWLSGGTRKVLGVSDPLSSLLAASREYAEDVVGSFHPVGSRFTIDFLLRAKGRKSEIPVRVEQGQRRRSLHLDDLRHVKRLADDRLGNVSRLIQFCVVGASGMVVDLTFYALFQLVLSRTPLSARVAPVVGGSLDLAVAGIAAIAIALTWNFSLNRRLTFSYARTGSILRQYVTYALSNAVGIGLSLFLRLYLPVHFDVFRRHKLAAAVVGIVTATGISFTLARWVVFGNRGSQSAPEGADARGVVGAGTGLPIDLETTDSPR